MPPWIPAVRFATRWGCGRTGVKCGRGGLPPPAGKGGGRMHEGKWPLHTSIFYQTPTDLYQRTISDDDYADRTLALKVGDRRVVDPRIQRGPRGELNGSANDVGVFPSVDAREPLPHHASEKSAVATPKVNSVKPFALGQS